MAESYVLLEDNYKEVCKRYMTIIKAEEAAYGENVIVCDDMRFEDRDGWCLMTMMSGDEVAEEILLELSEGCKLLYFYDNDDQLDCEFLVIDDNQVIRRKYIYSDLPELNRDDGHLKAEEEERAFLNWCDIDYFARIAGKDPYKLFER
ncbi:MAG: hypothetical protein NC337_04815 [Roseburia sp.]|nr:hypothetical protein [Roseburia sp.]